MTQQSSGWAYPTGSFGEVFGLLGGHIVYQVGAVHI